MAERKRDIFPLSKSRLRDNAKFQALSPSNQWFWIKMCLFLDDQEPQPGICRWDLDRIARAINAPLEALKILAKDEVLKGAPDGAECLPYIHKDRRGEEHTLIPAQSGPIWYSSAIVFDEYLRATASQSGRRGGGNPALRNTFKGASKGVVKGAPKGVGSDGVSPALSSFPTPLSPIPPTSPDLLLGLVPAEVSNVRIPTQQGGSQDEVEEIYQSYPRKVGKGFARKAIGNALVSLKRRGPAAESGETWASWLKGRVEAYAAATGRRIAADPSAIGFTPHPATWFNEGRYDDDPAEWEPRTRKDFGNGNNNPQQRQPGAFAGSRRQLPAVSTDAG